MLRGCLLVLLTVTFVYRCIPDALPPQLNSTTVQIFAQSRRSLSHVLKQPLRNDSLSTLFLLLSGDVQLNPGPRAPIYPCGICEQEVTFECKALRCDNEKCNIWFHHSCVDVDSREYSFLGRSTVQWLCPRCDGINCDTFTFNSFELSCYNSFSPLSGVGSPHSLNSFNSAYTFSPKHASSPNPCHSNSHKSTSQSFSNSSSSSPNCSSKNCPFDLPKKTNLRILNVNCQSVVNKRAELLTTLQYIKPDIVFGTESWLRGVQPGKPPSTTRIASSEVFPDDYNVFRNDRTTAGGGVFILTHKSLTAEEKPELVSDCETNWVKIKLQDRRDLYAGVFYMPHRNDKDPKELEKSLNKITKDGALEKDILLVGDFNCPDIDWTDHSIRPGAHDRDIQQDVIDITSSSFLTQIHHLPTRFSNSIDLIFTTNPSLAKYSNSIPGLSQSDHDMVVADFDTKPHITREAKRKIFKFNQADWNQLKTDLDSIAMTTKDQYEANADVDSLWSSFLSALRLSLEKNIPQTTLRCRRRLPWIDSSIRRLLRRKKRQYGRARVTNKWKKYRSTQKLCRRNIRRAELRYVNRTIQDGLDNNNTKPFWSYVKARRTDNIGVSPLRNSGTLKSDPRSKAEILLQQFKSVFTPPDSLPIPTLPQTTPPIPTIQISEAGVTKLLRDLKPNKAPGPDGIPNTVLKTCAENIAPSLSLIYQRSVDTGKLPNDWLTANVSAAYKKGDRHLAENYRPISLTSVPCKLLEHIICKHILHHLESNKILTSLNHGFRSGFSCETQLLTTTHDLLTSYDNGKQVDIAILDFSKAFDTVPHRKLLSKLSSYGVSGPLHNWLECFLTQRTMKVVLEGISSKTTTVDSGVPQGTVLGPLLFLCHINDLPAAASSQVRLFADDCLLYREINTFQDHITLQQDLRNLQQWANDWGMRFNATKCNILSIGNKSSYFYELDNTVLAHVENTPYLGLLISNNLKWGNHINKICKKANASLGFLRRNLRHLPTTCKKTAYLALVRSVLEYGAIIWDPHTKKDIDQLERVQRCAVRFIANDYTSRTPGCMTELTRKLNLPLLKDRRHHNRLCFFYKVVEGLVPALPSENFLKKESRSRRKIKTTTKKDFVTTNIVDNYVRNNDRCYNVQTCNTTELSESFFIKTVREWNALDNNTVNAPTVVAFGNLIRQGLAMDN